MTIIQKNKLERLRWWSWEYYNWYMEGKYKNERDFLLRKSKELCNEYRRLKIEFNKGGKK